MKRKLFIISMFLSAVLPVHSSIIDLRSGQETDKHVNTLSKREVKTFENGYEISYSFTNVRVNNENDESAQIWSYDDFGLYSVPGKPCIPARIENFLIPDGFNYYIELINSEFIELPADVLINQKPVSGKEPIKNTKNIHYFKGVYPQRIITEDTSSKYRGRNIGNVSVYPIQYNAETKTIKAYTKISFRITFDENGKFEKSANGRPNINDNDSFISNLSLVPIQSEKDSEQESISISPLIVDAPDYLIIASSKYSAAIKMFIEHKQRMGFNVIAECNLNWTPEKVKATIKSAYEKHPNLYYVTILGDYEDVPSYTSTLQVLSGVSMPDHVTDYYYGCMDGDDDTESDLLIGRLSFSSMQESGRVVKKIIQYETNPTTDNSYYDHVMVMGYFEDKNLDRYEDYEFIQRSELVRNYLQTQYSKTVSRNYFAESNVNPLRYNDGSLLPTELRRPNFSWNGDATMISNNFNSGSFLSICLTHGSVNTWGYHGFKSSHVEQLTNIPTVVFSTTCLTGRFNGQTCFAETFLRRDKTGAVGIIAATNETGMKYNHFVSPGVIDAIWPENTPENSLGFSGTNTRYLRIGDILKHALYRGYQNRPYPDQYLYHRETYHCFGDPSMKIYSEKPDNFDNTGIRYGMSGLNMLVTIYLEKTVENLYVYSRNITTNEITVGIGIGNKQYSFEYPIFSSDEYEIGIQGDNMIPKFIAVTLPQNQNNYTRENKVSLINENYVWKYRNNHWAASPYSYTYMRFSGTKEINGKSYHKLYEIMKKCADGDADIIPDFDFEQMTPQSYIRQEGDKYFMLLDNKRMYYYGSTTIESQIYDFGKSTGESWNICTQMDGDNFPSDFNPDPLPYEYVKPFEDYPIKKFEVTGWDEIQNEGKNWAIQETKYFKASPLLGTIENGSLDFPAYRTEAQGYYMYVKLVEVSTVDGDTVYRIEDISGIDDTRQQNPNEKYFDLQGRKVTRPETGIYIVRHPDGRIEKRVIR